MAQESEETGAIWTKAVIEHNRRWLLAYLYAATGDSALAEDLVQETFVVAYQKRAELETVPSFGAWLRGAARNVLRRHFEKQAHQPMLLNLTIMENLEKPAAELEQKHLDPDYEAARISVLRGCVQKLAQKSRLLIQGRYQENLSIEQLAKRTGLAPGSVPVILHRARAALLECITKKMALCTHSENDLS
ncbi:MAG TPA: sigma-70 family RNA polymerase sigma factor [Planctomycetota bacterium]|nr:sigma-70 family RNA polymerase sigma factor [Planctomycetota bacterium]